MKQCPLFEECSKFRQAAEEKFKEKNIWIAGRTTCYNPSWLLKNDKKCKNYHPELELPQPEKKTKTKKVKITIDDFRETVEEVKTQTRLDVIKGCLSEGVVDKKEMLKRLVKAFPKIDKKHLRYSIYNYYYNKGKAKK